MFYRITKDEICCAFLETFKLIMDGVQSSHHHPPASTVLYIFCVLVESSSFFNVLSDNKT